MAIKLQSGQIISDTDPNFESYKASPGATIIPSPVVPTPTPLVATPTDIYGQINYETPEERAFREQQASEAKTTATTPIDEATIRSNTLAKFQTEIDALNRVYAEKKAAEQLAGQGRMGGVAAVGARRGLIGSDFGVAQENQQTTTNTEAVNAIENERLAKEQAILSDARNYSDTEIKNKTEAKRLGAENYLKFISESANRKKLNTEEIAKKIYDSGVGDTTDFKTIADSLGVSIEALKSTYETYKKTADQAKSDKLKTDEAAKVEKEKELLKEGYAYVKTPAERDALKAKGYEIMELGGRTYSKVPKTTTKTIKANGNEYTITTDALGRVLNQTLIGSAGGTKKSNIPKTPKQTPEEKAWESDLAKARKDLATNGSVNWGKNWQYLQNQYGVDPATLDAILNKEQYTQ